MGGTLRYCGLVALGLPLWAGTSLKLVARMLVNPVRYFRKVDRRGSTFPDPLPDMQHIRVDSGGVKLHVATHGVGSGKQLMLMLHGFPETWSCWRHQIQEFAGSYEVAALDMRGYGDSDAPKGVRQYGIDKLCADVAAVITALGHTKAILVAHDWGGNVAWNMAVLFPQMVEQLVVLCCPHPAAYRDPQLFNSKQRQRVYYMLLFQARGLAEQYMRHTDFRQLDRIFLELPWGARMPGALTAKDVERYKAAFSRPGSLTGAINYYRATFLAELRWRLPAATKVLETPIKVPTLLLYADLDHALLPPMFKVEERLVPHCTSVCLEGCSHWAQQDKPDVVNKHIHAFLSNTAQG